jgi:hypothetical protein
MASNFIGTYSFNGDLSATLNTLTNNTNTGPYPTIDSLSIENYSEPFKNPLNPNDSPIKPNSQNQLIFMNQPMSWWLENLNSGAIYYFPYTNYVNWAYKKVSDEIHIDVEITNLIIPNEYKDSSGNTVYYKEKYGMGRSMEQIIM